MKVPDIDYQAEIRKCKTLDDLVRKNGLMKKLLKDVIQQLLEAEMDEHLGIEKYERDEESKAQEKNYHNGYSKKNINTLYGEVPIDVWYYVKKKYKLNLNKLFFIINMPF